MCRIVLAGEMVARDIKAAKLLLWWLEDLKTYLKAERSCFSSVNVIKIFKSFILQIMTSMTSQEKNGLCVYYWCVCVVCMGACVSVSACVEVNWIRSLLLPCEGIQLRCVCCYGMCVEVREQLRRVNSVHYVGPRNQTQAVRIGGKHLRPLSHIVGLGS